MQRKKEHSGTSTRPELIKYLALVIALCYVLNPLHHQISTVFHEFSHALEMPDTVIGHDSFSNNENIHHAHEHVTEADNHEHKLIKIIDSIFDASNTNESSEDMLLADFKFGKHITTDYWLYNHIFHVSLLQNFKSVENSLKLGHSTILEKPPRQAALPSSI
ncbi:hypothetical protein [Zobellia laminariae]|uniref:hypothetical protein n=1 Tax=Zobellia laminariae TaxID=248906 RepID=UPI0026F40E8C|nr:hypothetical protein [Zobellia laminariae]WKX76449.1 hypothetical protein Q5W13_23405 [Zobellia laminariae]